MRKTNLVKLFLASLIAGGAVFLAVHRRQPHAIAIGESAPDFTLPAIGSGSLALKNYRHRVVILNFWATWCPPCVQETPSLASFAERMRKKGVAVIGVSVDRDSAALEKFVAEYHLSFPIARDPDQAVASRYGTYQFPETYVLDRNGKVAEKIIGAIDWQDSRVISFVQELAGNSERPAS